MTTPYPKGAYIVNKNGERRKILEEQGVLRFVSIMQSTDPEYWETTVAYCPAHFLELKRDGWVIERKESGPKDEWPKVGELCWTFYPFPQEGISGFRWECSAWNRRMARSFGVYPTKEAAEAALRICQEALRKAGMMK